MNGSRFRYTSEFIFYWYFGLNGHASFRWSFGPNSAWGSIEPTTILATHPSLARGRRLTDKTQDAKYKIETGNTETLGPILHNSEKYSLRRSQGRSSQFSVIWPGLQIVAFTQDAPADKVIRVTKTYKMPSSPS